MRKLGLILVLMFLMVAPNVGADATSYVVDDFQKQNEGAFPKNWRGRSDDAKKFYRIASEDGGNRFLQARNDRTHEFVATEAKVDIAKFPTLKWRWRANSLPKNGDESVKKTCDSVAAVNVVIKASKWKPKTIKYTWSTTLKKGTETTSPFCNWPSKCDVIVLESGKANMGKWVTESRNVLEDYKRLYGKDDVKSFEIDAILIMSDGDNTDSFSAADYDDIRFTK